MSDTLLREATFDDIIEELDRRANNEGVLLVQYKQPQFGSKTKGFVWNYKGCAARVLGWLDLIADEIRKDSYACEDADTDDE